MNIPIPDKIVLIGASTGGPGQIKKIINALPKLQNTTIIIAQHMVEGFMYSFRDRLQETSENKISMIKDNQTIYPANIYICEGETRLDIDGSKVAFSQKKSLLNAYNPDINILFNSFIPLCKKIEILCVILTGIGDDGVDACKNMSINGVKCITENKQSAIVDGMPNRARELVPNIEVYDINEIVKIISEICE